MQLKNNAFLYSPSDLITFMESPYASAMERARLFDSELSKLIDPEDVLLVSLQKKGIAHEDKFTETLKAEGRVVLETKRATPEIMARETIRAMKEGKEVITQGYLALGQFAGIADYLVKVPGPSKLGDYHYEVWDTKLSKKLKPYFAIQLCCYVEMLESIQGVQPKHMAIVLGDDTIKPLMVDHYYAYYQSLKTAFLAFHDNPEDALPDPAMSKSYGRWSTLAHEQLVKRDHLSQVANLSHQQIKNLGKVGIMTMQQLADCQIPSVPNMSAEVFERAKKQARLQIASRGLEVPKYEILPHEPDVLRGLSLLPPHSDMDVFFDIEGYPGIDGGIEYLWGNTFFDDQGKRAFKDFWAHNAKQEKQIFVEFINWVYARWLADPSMHVYHYANYEIAAIRKLMGRYGVCEEMVDNLLRNKVFVDLYNVVRHGLMIGEPRYSIKNVEHIYRGKRDTEVASGGESIIVYENWRENPDGDTWQTSAILKSIRDYNIDDCDSTQELAEWLRTEQVKHGIAYLIPEGEGEKELPEEVTELTQLRDKILQKAEWCDDGDERRLLEILAWSLEFHRRENKPTWWRLFDRMGWDEADLYDDMDCLAGLVRTKTPPFLPTKRSKNKVYEYKFDANQPFKGQGKNYYVLGPDELKITRYDFQPDSGKISFQYKAELPSIMSLVPNEFVGPKPIPGAIKSVVETLMAESLPACAIVDFLARKRPRIMGNAEGKIIKDNEEFLSEVIQAAVNLEGSYLCIQGPPGAGKTYTARHIIGELLRQGKRVGVSSNSHKAILNLMTGMADHIADNGITATLVKAGGDKDDPAFGNNQIKHIASVKNLQLNDNICFGGTAWAFCNDCVEDEFDYLFIDEAGQVSVANLIGMSRSCKNIILMGDQMQLGQPMQGSHPGESGMSILEYLLEGQATIPDDIGVFLPKTYRMHPAVCSLISKQVYEGKLTSVTSTKNHEIEVTGPIITKPAGICFVPVEHEGNKQASDEEVQAIQAIVNELLDAKFWPDEDGKPRFIGWNDILFVAPYNYQVNKLRAVLGEEAHIGSVDKFQGKEAPIVILSMCASDASESPRGIDFLFSKNRLNVAISRAQALAIVVGNPKLASTQVSNLKQMELVNFFCEISDGF
ncbi:MAG: helicase [Alphaproteobacteria bacterium]|nr:MAG: helicase [Alphaproteobacteria bacterium]